MFNKQLEQHQADIMDARETYYSGRPAEEAERLARFHVGIHVLLEEYGITENEITDQTLDDNHDQGIDFFYKPDTDGDLFFVIQVKDHKSLALGEQKAAITKMVTEIKFLSSRQRVDRKWPERRQERFYSLKDAEKRGYEMTYVLLLTGGAKAAELGDHFAPELIERNSESVVVIDEPAMLKLRSNIGPNRSEPEITLPLPEKHFEFSSHHDQPRMIQMLIAVNDYVHATRGKQEIFALNPRVYLGSNKTNKKIIETLDNPDDRQQFHYFNNGITAVCKAMKRTDDDVVLNDFQVVNGCQTTTSLWKAVTISSSPGTGTDFSKVFVPLRIIETGEKRDFALRISETTNSQSAISSADLVSTRQEQRQIKAELEKHVPPYFYEARRGGWNAKSKGEREPFFVGHAQWDSYQARNIYRKLKLKELGQALMAAKGQPHTAKEQVSSLFRDTGESSNYMRIYRDSFDDISQVAAVIELALFVNSLLWFKQRRDEESKKNLAKLGRYYLIWIVYRLYDEYGQGADQCSETAEQRTQLLTGSRSRALLNEILENPKKIARWCNLSVTAMFTYEKRNEVNRRDLLRQGKHRSEIWDKVTIAVEDFDDDTV